jgi:hypothetical protein
MYRFAPLVLILALTVASCSDDPEPPTTASPPTSKATSTTKAPTPEEEVRAVMEAWAEASIRLRLDPDPEDPALATYLTGRMLEEQRRKFAGLKERGEFGHQPEPSVTAVRIESIEIRDREATIVNCDVDDLQLMSPAGEILNDRIVSVRFSIGAVREDGAWKLATATPIEAWENRSQC